MKNKCNYYEVEYAKLPDPHTGKLIIRRIEHCLGVKENDLCSCSGYKIKCNFPECKTEQVDIK